MGIRKLKLDGHFFQDDVERKEHSKEVERVSVKEFRAKYSRSAVVILQDVGYRNKPSLYFTEDVAIRFKVEGETKKFDLVLDSLKNPKKKFIWVDNSLYIVDIS